MRVLLDECVPRQVGGLLTSSDVPTVEMAGYKGIENGDLLRAAEGRFDVLITADKNLRYQQNLGDRRIALIELPFNSWPRLKLMERQITEAMDRIKPGDYVQIESID